ncbi:MAG: methyltransferase domain-containing protein [Pseudomonadota bacterium]
MRTDIVDLHGFYASSLGTAAAALIIEQLRAAWPDERGCRVAGFGYCEPFLKAFPDAERTIAMAPAGQGVIRWPTGEPNRASLVAEHHWPLPDASVDRLLIAHGLEETGKPQQLMREAWRVLSDQGRVIIIASHRRGAWSMVDSTPFAAGRPYLNGQLKRLLVDAMFTPARVARALYLPPLQTRIVVRAANSWEKTGALLWPWLGGILLIEARKDLARPATRALRAQRRLTAPSRPAFAQPSSRDRNNLPDFRNDSIER